MASPSPTATLTNTTASGDVIASPGAPTRILNGLPIACLGDAVTGAACVGVISETTAINRICLGRPTANLTSTVAGANPATGAPVTTVVSVVPNANRVL